MENYNSTLIYKIGSSHTIRVETVNKKESYFKHEYDDSLKLINEIVKSQKEDELSEDGCNNRILITGQRGSGKTSVMRSLADYLRNPVDDDGKTINVKCYVLDMIDPSHFDKNNNILLTVVTKMYSKAKDLMKQLSNENVNREREELLKEFEKVFKSFESIKSEITSYTLETLNKKSEAEDLRSKMHGFVQAFLEFFNVADTKSKMNGYSKLVLPIDDIDMSVSYSFEMMEQLRKYLDLDNLIIIMSANITQLFNEIREHYSRAFKNTLTLLKDKNQDLYYYVEDQASKYLVKLFPTSRRINVERRIEQLLKTQLQIKKKQDNNTKEENWTVIKGGEGQLQKVILATIWRKTRLIFTLKDQDHTLHPIIPTNLRDLTQFIDVLVSLEDVNIGNKGKKLFENIDEYERCKNNIRVFKNYFMNIWIPNRLSVEEERVFENIPSDITEINKHLINSINVIGTQHKRRLMSREVGLDMIERNAENINIDRDIYTMVSPNDPKFVKANKISDIFNQPSNYSYGDLLLMIDKYETYFESGDDRKFTDAIKIYYTILLFETMFFDSTTVKYDKPDNNVDLNDLVIPIQKLIGGTVYYPNYFEIIKDKYFNQKGPSFDAKRAFYHKLPIVGENKVGDRYPFYAVLYYGDIRPDRYDTKHIYDTTFDNDANIDGTNYVTFDILSILSNMLNPWHTYYRAGEKVEDNKDENDEKSWKRKIESWKDFCEIMPTDKTAKNEIGKEKKDESKYIPNSILPFYSVDMMLNYLKESIEVSKIIEAYPESVYKKYDDFKLKGRKLLFSSMTTDNDFFKKLEITIIKAHIDYLIDELYLDQLVLDECKKLLHENEFDKLRKRVLETPISEDFFVKNKPEYANNRRSSPKWKNEFEKWKNEYTNRKTKIASWINECTNVFIKEDGVEEETLIKPFNEMLGKIHENDKFNIVHYVGILLQALKKKEDCVSNKPSDFQFKDVTNNYLNELIQILLKEYPENQKERDTLIKELHKYTTPSEIFKHLVESLWDNKITEIYIRSDIQEKVRREKSVDNYYNKLWKKTETLLDLDADNAISIYCDIFNKAAKKFITEKHFDQKPSKDLN